jgi:hypothetical protein
MDFFQQLMGRWSFSRDISGHGSMTGVAHFDAVDAGIATYWESGEVALASGERLRAQQRYLYERIDDGFAVRFEGTKELFQSVVFAADGDAGWIGNSSHLCKADKYESRYCFLIDGTFVVRHVVSGPHKDYAIRTVYRRDVID